MDSSSSSSEDERDVQDMEIDGVVAQALDQMQIDDDPGQPRRRKRRGVPPAERPMAIAEQAMAILKRDRSDDDDEDEDVPRSRRLRTRSPERILHRRGRAEEEEKEETGEDSDVEERPTTRMRKERARLVPRAPRPVAERPLEPEWMRKTPTRRGRYEEDEDDEKMTEEASKAVRRSLHKVSANAELERRRASRPVNSYGLVEHWGGRFSISPEQLNRLPIVPGKVSQATQIAYWQACVELCRRLEQTNWMDEVLSILDDYRDKHGMAYNNPYQIPILNVPVTEAVVDSPATSVFGSPLLSGLLTVVWNDTSAQGYLARAYMRPRDGRDVFEFVWWRMTTVRRDAARVYLTRLFMYRPANTDPEYAKPFATIVNGPRRMALSQLPPPP